MLLSDFLLLSILFLLLSYYFIVDFSILVISLASVIVLFVVATDLFFRFFVTVFALRTSFSYVLLESRVYRESLYETASVPP